VAVVLRLRILALARTNAALRMTAEKTIARRERRIEF